MASRSFLRAAAGFLTDLFTGRDRGAERRLIQRVGQAEAARIARELTGKRLKAPAEEVRSKPLEAKPKPGPGEDGDVIIVSGSSNVHSFGYLNESRELHVRYLGGDSNHRAGPGPAYVYYNVPKGVFERLKSAGSKGGAVWDMLRIRGSAFGHQFDYSLEGSGAGGYVPRKQTGHGLKPREIKQGGKTYRSNRPGTGRFKGE